jgi:hypothetical protein
VAELPSPVAPDQATVLAATLPEGEYVLYCPLEEGEHRSEGMGTTLTVVP